MNAQELNSKKHPTFIAHFSSQARVFCLAGVIASVALLSACGQAGAEGTTEEAIEEVKVIPIPVEVQSVKTGDISSNYMTTAVLEAKEEAFVVARASGIIQEIMVEEGDYVEKGQVLAQIEPRRYHLNLDRAKANLVGIEKELNKIDKVYSKKLISDDTYDKVTAQYKSAKVTLSLAELDLKEATIVAPIAGFIAERNAKVGNLTESFQRARMFHIVQQKELYGIVYLPEKELSKVHKDQQASLELTAFAGQISPAYVERISPVIDAKTGTFKVTLRVPNPNNTLKAGMFAQVKLNYDTHKNAVLLPRKALLSIDDSVNVFVINKGIANKLSVSVGYQEGEYVEIISGLTGDEQVVVTGHHNLRDKAPVEIVNQNDSHISNPKESSETETTDKHSELAKG